MADGARILAQDVREAIRFLAERRTTQISDFRKGEQEKPASKVRLLSPELREIRKNLGSDPCDTRAKLHIPRLKELLESRVLGGGQMA